LLPDPARVRVVAALPVIVPDKIVAPLEVKLELLVTANAFEIVPPEVTESVPPFNVMVPPPMLPAPDMESVPAFTDVPAV
jgi:hypothetical protein